MWLFLLSPIKSASSHTKDTKLSFPVPTIVHYFVYKVFLLFAFVDEIRKCGHSNGSYWAVLSCNVVYYARQGAFSLCL